MGTKLLHRLGHSVPDFLLKKSLEREALRNSYVLFVDYQTSHLSNYTVNKFLKAEAGEGEKNQSIHTAFILMSIYRKAKNLMMTTESEEHTTAKRF